MHKKLVITVRPIIVLVIFLILSNFFSLFLFIRHKWLNSRYNNEYPFIDISRNFIPQEHFIINFQPLREDLKQLVQEASGQEISLYFEFLNTGANISINPDLKIWPASLTKLPLAMIVLKKEEEGDWGFNDQLAVFEEDKNDKSGELFSRTLGSLTIKELLSELLISSDNTAFNILMRNVSILDVDKLVSGIGLEELFTEEGKVSAKEYSRILRALYVSSFLKKDNSTKILNWLVESSFDDYLSQGMPEGVVFAHKFGENETYSAYADSGIVYLANRPYLLSVMIKSEPKNGGREQAMSLMKVISGKVYRYVKSY